MIRLPNTYEREALRQIEPLRASPEFGGDAFDPSLAKAAEAPASLFDRAKTWALRALQTIAVATLRPSRLLQRFRREGYRGLASPGDVKHLSLHEVDRVAEGVGPRYVTAGVIVGVGAGALGVEGMIADLPFVATLALRAVGEVAAFYGFDPANEIERVYARRILEAAGIERAIPRDYLLSRATRMGKRFLPEKAQRFVPIADETKPSPLAALPLPFLKSRRLARWKTRFLPIVGAIAGAAFNAVYLKRVCDLAMSLYRGRFLRDRYGETALVLASDSF